MSGVEFWLAFLAVFVVAGWVFIGAMCFSLQTFTIEETRSLNDIAIEQSEAIDLLIDRIEELEKAGS